MDIKALRSRFRITVRLRETYGHCLERHRHLRMSLALKNVYVQYLLDVVKAAHEFTEVKDVIARHTILRET